MEIEMRLFDEAILAETALQFLDGGLGKAEVFRLLKIWDNQNDPPFGNEGLKKIVEDVYGQRFPEKKAGPKIPRIKFPRHTIKGMAKDFADTYSQYMESPWSFWAFSFLTALGNILSDRITVRSQIAPQPRLYTIILGESWDVRKSTAIRETITFFKNTFPEDFYSCGGVGSAEGLARILKDNAKTLLIYDEFRHFAEKAGIRNSVLGLIVNSLFESNEYDNAVKGESVSIKNANLSILGASTLETFEKMWNPYFRAIGFLNRLWLVPDEIERTIPIPLSIPSDKLMGLQKRMQDFYRSLPIRKTEVTLEREAEAIWNQYYITMHSIYSPFVKRLDVYGLRLMVLFCANEGKDQVNADMVYRIMQLLEWQLQVRRLTDPIDAENAVAEMEQAIRRALRKKGGLTDRELQRQTNATRKGLWAYNSALTNLKHSKELGSGEGIRKWSLLENAL